MIKTEDFKSIVNLLKDDPKYNSFADGFDQMHYLVKRQSKQLRQFGQSVLEQCSQYESAHRKSTVMAKCCLDRARLFSQKYHQGEPFGELDYYELMATWDKALRYLPTDCNDWSTMVTLMEVYVERAQIEFDCGQNKKAMADLGHASSVLYNCNNPAVMIDHFYGDANILITMLYLKTKLLEELEGSKGEMIRQVLESHQLFAEDIKSVQLKTADDITVALDTLRKLDSIAGMYNQQVRLEDPIQETLLDVNYAVTKKIYLNESSEEGRIYVASQDMAKQEPVLAERAFSLIFFDEYSESYCNYCHRMLDTFWPCGTCTEVVFCSAKCCTLASQEYHHDECGIFGLILGKLESGFYSMAHLYRHCVSFGLDVVRQCEQQESNVINGSEEPFDIGQYFSSKNIRHQVFQKQAQPEKQLMYRSMSSLLSHRGKRPACHEHGVTAMALACVHFLIYKGKLPKTIVEDCEEYSRLLEHMAIAMNRIHTNGFAWAEEVTVPMYSEDPNEVNTENEIVKIASCIFFVSSFFNHSCHPNTDWEISPNGTIYFTARRSIASGEPLTVCYGPKRHNEFERRQARLHNDYCFFCRCVVCMKDAANLSTTLKCELPDGSCFGPLVMNKFQACLKCGHQLSNETRARFLAGIVNRSSQSFMNTYQKLFRDKPRFSALSCVRGFGRYEKPTLRKEDNETFVRLQEETEPVIGPVVINRAQITMKRIAKLEKHFVRYTEVIYNASYHLLEKCVLLLKVYHEMGFLEQGLNLMGFVSGCLEDIYPQMSDPELVKLVYMLDYAAFFYEKLALKNVNTSSQAISGDATAECEAEPNAELLSLCARLNTKLKDILQYDLDCNGEFFPKLYRTGGSIEDDGLDEIVKKDEMYFCKVFKQCIARLHSAQLATKRAQD